MIAVIIDVAKDTAVSIPEFPNTAIKDSKFMGACEVLYMSI